MGCRVIADHRNAKTSPLINADGADQEEAISQWKRGKHPTRPGREDRWRGLVKNPRQYWSEFVWARNKAS